MFDMGVVEPSRKRQILVTGSGRLDLYRHGGDSLQGRYHYLRLMPLSFAELGGRSPDLLMDLFRYSGFPEPFFLQSEKQTRRWSREYQARIVRDDIRELERTYDLATCELCLGRLPECVGSPLSLNNLREDLQVAYKTVDNWVQIFERLYILFRIPPLSGTKIRAVKKEKKAYFYNWTLVHDEAARFENLIAVHLLKYVYWQQDVEGRDVELRYFRDSDGREVDFVILENTQPIYFVECKLGDQELSASLRYLANKYRTAVAFQLHLLGKKSYETPDRIRVCHAAELLKDFV
jgi:predicted AAA+ superfamily ATPase